MILTTEAVCLWFQWTSASWWEYCGSKGVLRSRAAEMINMLNYDDLYATFMKTGLQCACTKYYSFCLSILFIYLLHLLHCLYFFFPPSRWYLSGAHYWTLLRFGSCGVYPSTWHNKLGITCVLVTAHGRPALTANFIPRQLSTWSTGFVLWIFLLEFLNRIYSVCVIY